MFFQIYGETAGWQLLGWLLVFAGLVIMNEIARRSKWGGIACFLVLPAVLSVYFIAIYIGAASGAEWALNNDTYVHMNSWFHYAKLYAATAGCIGFMILKYHWGKLGKAHWFKAFPFVIVAINILIAVASDFESAIRAGSLAGGWWLSSEGVWLYGGWWNVLNGLAGSFQYRMYDRLVGHLLLQKQAGYAVAGYDLGIRSGLRRLELPVYLPEPADPFLVLRSGAASGAHLRGGTLE